MLLIQNGKMFSLKRLTNINNQPPRDVIVSHSIVLYVKADRTQIRALPYDVTASH